MSLDACFAEIRSKHGEDVISTKELKKIINEVAEIKKYHGPEFEQAVDEYIQYAIQAQKELAVAKISSVKRINEMKTFLENMQTEGRFGNKKAAALRAVLDGQALESTGSNLSVDRLQSTYHAIFQNEVDKVRTDMEIPEDILVSDEFNMATIQELHHLAKKEMGFATDNKYAQAVAKAMNNSYESIRKTFLMLGKPVGYVQNYAGWRKYDKAKVLAGKDKFIEMLSGSGVDQTTFKGMTPEMKAARIEEMWNHITTGDSADFTKHRSIFFSDAKTEFEFLKAFGAFPDHWTSFQAQIQTAAKQSGIMHMFGPEPEYTFNSLLEWAIPDSDLRTRTLTKNMFDDLKGRLSTNISSRTSELVHAARLVTTLRYLGGSVITAAIPDTVALTALASTVDGRGALPLMGSTLSRYFKSWSPAQRKKIAQVMLLNSYDALATYADSAQAGMNGRLTKAVTTMFKWNGLQPHSESVRSSMALTVGNILHDHADTAFDQLPKELLSTFNRYRIDAKDWDIMRMARESVDDIGILSPDGINSLKGLSAAQKANTLVKYGAMINDYAKLTTLESSATSRQLLYWGQVDGTFLGEMLRTFSMFKQAGINTMRMQARLAHSMDKASYAGALATFTAAGYMTYVAREFLLKGRTPPNPDTRTEEGRVEWAIIAMESANRGFGGIIGDVLTAEYNKQYRSLPADITGPVVSDLGKVAKLSAAVMRGEYDQSEKEIIELGKSMTNVVFPITLPVIKPIIDATVFDTIHNAVNPNYELNRRLKLRKRGQKQIKDLM